MAAKGHDPAEPRTLSAVISREMRPQMERPLTALSRRSRPHIRASAQRRYRSWLSAPDLRREATQNIALGSSTALPCMEFSRFWWRTRPLP